MQQLVPHYPVQSGEVAELKGEAEVLDGGRGLVLEPDEIRIDLITEKNKCPQPADSFQKVVSVQRNPEPLVLEELALMGLREVLVVGRD